MLVFLVSCGGQGDAVDTTSKVAETTANSVATTKQSSVDVASKAPNFLIMIGDDMAVETIGCYKVGSTPATAPNLDNLCNQGIRFDNFWSQPVCSPTRATILSGQYGFRTGIGGPARAVSGVDFPTPDKLASAPKERSTGPASRGGGAMGGMGMAVVNDMGAEQENSAATREGYIPPSGDNPGLYADAYGLPKALKANASLGYQTAAVGKWHLADNTNGKLEHPANVGFDHYAGSIRSGGVESFYAWSKVVDGTVTEGDSTYTTTQTVNDAVSWLGKKDADKPWLLWVAFNAPHSPWGDPPNELLSAETIASMQGKDVFEDSHPFYLAMIEAMDTEIGRLLASIDPEELDNTYLIFMGDNGTPDEVVRPPFSLRRAKGTVYQGGVNVPFMMRGPDINAGTVSMSLANSVDLYLTILDLAGTGADPKLNNVVLDSVSLVPLLQNQNAKVRGFAYADAFGSVGGNMKNLRAIRNERFKLIADLHNDTEELYDLSVDPYENSNLLATSLTAEASENLGQLKQLLNTLNNDQ